MNEREQVPETPLVMHQRWRRLLFLHWSRPVAEVQATLPPGLFVDAWEGRAWVGLVPFVMRAVRPRFLPAVPGVSDFLEMNVRTYVRDALGRPGVWFYSLDCDQPVAVAAARSLFCLPYRWAAMSEEVALGGTITYACRRRGTREASRLVYRPGRSEARPAAPASFEEFLVERYRLFAFTRGGLRAGEVRHAPYRLQPVEVRAWSALAVRQAGFPLADEAPPEHATFAPGVDVGVFWFENRTPDPIG